MGKKARLSRMRREALGGSGFGGSKFEKDIAEIFFGVGQQPLTEDLIQKLLSMGWRESDLRLAASQGATYSESRNSLMFPGGAF